MTSGQLKTRTYFGFTGFTAAKGRIVLPQAGTGSAMDRTVYTATTQQVVVGRINDGIDIQTGNVTL
jgi:hypothetical protein